MSLDWQDPPTPTAGRGSGTNWTSILAELRTRPGQWALVQEGVATTNAGGLRRRFPDFEFTGRRDTGGDGRRGRIFARYIGEGER